MRIRRLVSYSGRSACESLELDRESERGADGNRYSSLKEQRNRVEGIVDS